MFEDIVQFLSANKDWVFSGIGIAIISFIARVAYKAAENHFSKPKIRIDPFLFTECSDRKSLSPKDSYVNIVLANYSSQTVTIYETGCLVPVYYDYLPKLPEDLRGSKFLRYGRLFFYTFYASIGIRIFPNIAFSCLSYNNCAFVLVGLVSYPFEKLVPNEVCEIYDQPIEFAKQLKNMGFPDEIDVIYWCKDIAGRIYISKLDSLHIGFWASGE